MLGLVDDFLNRTTMYRLVRWVLLVYLIIAIGESLLGWLPYSPLAISGSTVLILAVSWGTQALFTRVWRIPTTAESWWISALILALILAPPHSLADRAAIVWISWATIWTISSKFVVTIDRAHLFNPVAFGVTLVTTVLGGGVSWWVGSLPLLPPTVIGGWLILRKLRRGELVSGFLIVATGTVLVAGELSGVPLMTSIRHLLAHSPLVFVGTIMLTEPLTLPATRSQQLLIGGLTGLLFAPSFHLGPLTFAPEQALLVGNALGWLLAPRARYRLMFHERHRLGPSIVEFQFMSDRPPSFIAGQATEWTLLGPTDERGNRRTFTIASAPSEPTVRFAMRIGATPSAFKRQLLALKPGDETTIGPISGSFTLPRDPTTKLAFIAGGIGITPFRSMVAELLHETSSAAPTAGVRNPIGLSHFPLTSEVSDPKNLRGFWENAKVLPKTPGVFPRSAGHRDIVLLYSAKTTSALAYRSLFARATSVGLRPVYTLTDRQAVPASWTGQVGRIDAALISSTIPDYRERTFYLSGPTAMVRSFKQTLRKLGVSHWRIKADEFPGF